MGNSHTVLHEPLIGAPATMIEANTLDASTAERQRQSRPKN
jgi:hypothetical protein